MPTSREIRQQFIDFFVQKHGHTFVPSSPVVPHDDPTLLFTNAGMNQFKPIFLGTEKRDYTRAVNTQKCIRAGGKHNDLDDVGRSRRHHTFFEMLGNWSFGDYFKREAIGWSWELLTKVWGLDPTRLHVSVHGGDPAAGVPRDDEAADIWHHEIGIPRDRIHYGGKDNFWEMGDTGPCGPCTEIFIDRTPDKTGGKDVLSGDDPRVMEIWNNVFIQYNREYTEKGRALLAAESKESDPVKRRELKDQALANRELISLPAKHVDTGMGFERITQVLQGKDDNYAIDLFDPFWSKLKDLCGRGYTGKFPKTNAADPEAEAADEQLRTDIAFRVIGDHVRCLTFALTDGATVSNEGRGYVLRRILRRAARFGRQTLELKQPFLHELVDVVVGAMGDAFPELKRDPKRVAEMIKDEEVSFGRTLDRGIALFDEAAHRGGGKRISDQDAFKLHDTYGFPIDLTQQMAVERGMSVDVAGYEKLMEEAKDLARRGGKAGDSPVYDLPPAILDELAKQGVRPTDDSHKYKPAPLSARVVGIWNGSNLIDRTDTREDQEVAVLLDRTSFYAEMGGQVGDAGTIRADGAIVDIDTTRVVGGYVLHVGRVRAGTLVQGDGVVAELSDKRTPTQQNHTATHLANWALREVLGDGVQQKGSLVDAEKLRFDLSHNKAVADDEIGRVEQLVGEQVAKKLPVYAEEAPQAEAMRINGLRAVFGEKYPPRVRVVSIGAPVAELLREPASEKWRQFSVEFCGGTHLGNTGEIGAFTVTAEESVSKGVRRIVALTGSAASAALQAGQHIDRVIAGAKGAQDADLPKHIAQIQQSIGGDAAIPLLAKRRAQAAILDLQARYKKFEKSQKSSAAIDVAAVAQQLLADATDRAGGKVVVGSVDGASDDQLRGVIDSLRKRQPSLAVMLASAGDGRVSFVSAVSDDLIAKGLKAGDWIRDTAKAAGGGGGGRPQMAQAGGKDPSKLADALAVAKAFAEKTLG
jgi:alanyl-tRNA synthetase